jgi:glycine betaine/proline transport system substrate-binding protein
MYTHHRWQKMVDVEIKRGYEILPDNNVRFGIRITNGSDVVISDVEVILDYSESLFKLEGERVQKVGVIPPAGTRTAEFILKPLGCVHKVNIEALISYRDTKYIRKRVDMHPKEVHCVCPFLKGKAMPRAEFLELSSVGYSAEGGLNFKGVSVERLSSYLVQTCKNRHHKVDDYSVDGGRMLYLASESIGEKAYYLLTALIKDDDGFTQVMLRVASDKSHGLNGFLNETVAELRHVVSTVQLAQEIGVIKKQQVINIIDSIVQRTSFGGEGNASVNIEGSVVQRTEFKDVDENFAKEGNSIGMKFTHVPAGEFMMGSIDGDETEKPVHNVKINKPFYLGIYPVTQHEWKTVMGDNPSTHYNKGDDFPVESVSWNDVQEFISKLNAKEGTDTYRLPSEAEWEYACRAGSTKKYCFGDDSSKLGEYAWYIDNCDYGGHPVGKKKPNDWGLYDMHGNVWEWVQDKWHDDYSGAPSDGSVWGGGDNTDRINRGGGGGFSARCCRSALRSCYTSNGSSAIGFRLLLES